MNTNNNLFISGLTALDDLLMNDDSQSTWSTGLCSLDEILNGGLKPKIYVLGGNSSVGKTTFALQMAADIAKTGKPVLFVNYEQSYRVLLAKIISRESVLADESDLKNAYSSSRITDEDTSGDLELRRFLENHCTVLLDNIMLYCPDSDISLEALTQAVELITQKKGNSPVVFIDYLQLLATTLHHENAKINVDETILYVRELIKKYQIPIVLISSLNRSSYDQRITMGAFKESGLIEYSADVLLGLENITNMNSNLAYRSRIQPETRDVLLRILKNKEGTAFKEIKLVYTPEFNIFEEYKGGNY